MSNARKILSLSCLMIALGIVYAYNSSVQNKILSTLGIKKTVYVAKKEIPEQQRIYVDYAKGGAAETPQFSKRSVYAKYIQPSAVVVGSAEEKELLKKGTRHMTLSYMAAGEQLMMSKLAEVSQEGIKTLADEISITKRALSIPVDALTGVSKLIKPGNRVDILAGLSWKKGFTKVNEFKTILENVHILAVGNYTKNHVPDYVNNEDVPAPRELARYSTRYPTVTVEVSPSEAQILVYSLSQGQKLFLTLRNPADKVITDITTTTVDEVLGENSKKADARRKALLRNRKPASPRPKAVKKKVNPFKQGGGVFN